MSSPGTASSTHGGAVAGVGTLQDVRHLAVAAVTDDRVHGVEVTTGHHHHDLLDVGVAVERRQGVLEDRAPGDLEGLLSGISSPTRVPTPPARTTATLVAPSGAAAVIARPATRPGCGYDGCRVDLARGTPDRLDDPGRAQAVPVREGLLDPGGVLGDGASPASIRFCTSRDRVVQGGRDRAEAVALEVEVAPAADVAALEHVLGVELEVGHRTVDVGRVEGDEGVVGDHQPGTRNQLLDVVAA